MTTVRSAILCRSTWVAAVTLVGTACSGSGGHGASDGNVTRQFLVVTQNADDCLIDPDGHPSVVLTLRYAEPAGTMADVSVRLGYRGSTNKAVSSKSVQVGAQGHSQLTIIGTSITAPAHAHATCVLLGYQLDR